MTRQEDRPTVSGNPAEVTGNPAEAREEREEDPIHGDVDANPIVWTTAICAVAAAAGHGILWLAYGLEWNTQHDTDVPWQPVAGISLSTVAIVAFGGFYLASRRARIAIASSFLLTFLITLSFVLTLQGLAEATTRDAQLLFDDFRQIVVVIIGFYFGTEAALSIAKVIGTSRATTDPVAVARSDRDLVAPERRN